MVTDHMMSRLSLEPVLVDLSDRDLLDLLSVMEEARLPPDKVLTWEETPVREFGILLEGSIGVFWGADRHGALTVGDTFGAEELLGDRCWRQTLVTEGPVRVLVADWGQFRPLVARNPRFAALLGSSPVVDTTLRSRRRISVWRRAGVRPAALA